MLSIEGVYNGKTIKPIVPIKLGKPTRVIITFLDEKIKNEMTIKHEIEMYKMKASEFDFGDNPDTEYKKELQEIYSETLTTY